MLKGILNYIKTSPPVIKRSSIIPRRQTNPIQKQHPNLQQQQNINNKTKTKQYQTYKMKNEKQTPRQEMRRRVGSQSKHLNKTKARKSSQRAANVHNPNRQESLQSYWIIRKRRPQKGLCSSESTAIPEIGSSGHEGIN